jgi:hypothetical protein
MLLAYLGTLLGGCPTLAASGPNALLSDEELYQLTVGELEERLARSERLTALPVNVAGVFCPESGTPLFIVVNEGRHDQLSDTAGDYVQNYPAFCVVRFGTLLGASSDEVVMIGAHENPRDP